MKPLESFALSIKDCLVELAEFEQLLASKLELKEKNDILPFFNTHRHLAAYVASYAPTIANFDRLALECSLFGDFRADMIVGDSVRKSYCLIEFEDATKDSIFKSKGRTTSEWSPRFEHGFGQIVDWFWKIDSLRDSPQARTIFGADTFSFMGMLVIGRDAFLSPEEVIRLEWRINKVTINSNKIVCLTFDQLAKGLRDSLTIYT
jgi:Domain of unknown function (DUF4263)